MNKRDKKAIAPVITTILLVLLVLVLASIILLWGITFIPEALTKFGGPIENSCSDVSVSAQITGNAISVTNLGSVPVHRFKIRLEDESSSEEKESNDDLPVGGAVSIDPIDASDTKKLEDYDDVSLIPVLLGETDEGGIQEFYCGEENWVSV